MKSTCLRPLDSHSAGDVVSIFAKAKVAKHAAPLALVAGLDQPVSWADGWRRIAHHQEDNGATLATAQPFVMPGIFASD
jgi:hypothetical protein